MGPFYLFYSGCESTRGCQWSTKRACGSSHGKDEQQAHRARLLIGILAVLSFCWPRTCIVRVWSCWWQYCNWRYRSWCGAWFVSERSGSEAHLTSQILWEPMPELCWVSTPGIFFFVNFNSIKNVIIIKMLFPTFPLENPS
jgi:hypothetical protein